MTPVARWMLPALFVGFVLLRLALEVYAARWPSPSRDVGP